jgi:hypothetical protein
MRYLFGEINTILQRQMPWAEQLATESSGQTQQLAAESSGQTQQLAAESSGQTQVRLSG